MNYRGKSFSAAEFGTQLKRLRLYRGYHTQSDICTELDISRQVWSLWERGQRTPNLEFLSALGNHLKVDISYFFITGANPGEFDLTLDYHKLRLEKMLQEDRKHSFDIMPFVKTSVAGQIFRTLRRCFSRRGFFSMNLFPKSGNSRAFLEFCKKDPAIFQVIECQSFTKESDADFIILDRADKLGPDVLEAVLNKELFPQASSIILAGINIKQKLEQFRLLRKIEHTFFIDCVSIDDFSRIIKKALPEVDDTMTGLIKMESRIRLNDLYEIIKKIKEFKEAENRKNISLEILLRLYQMMDF